ncbi:MAG: alpha/beta hydrolase [Pseudomonadota bacterium]
MCDASLWRDCTPDPAGLPIAKPVPPGRSIADIAAWCLESHEGPLLPIGFSMGGIIALECLRQAPDRIAGLGLVSTNPGADRPDRAPIRRRQQNAVKAGRLMDVVNEELVPSYFAAENGQREELVQHVADMAAKIGPEAFIAQSEALRLRNSLWPTLETFTGPVLILCGTEDRVCLPALHEEMAAACVRPSLCFIPGAGHMLPIEQPVAVRSEIGAWLSRTGFTAVEEAGS